MEYMAKRLAIFAMATIGVLGLAACGGSESEDPPDASLLSVSGTEYSFDAADTVAAGPTTLRLSNDGEEDHELHLMRLNDGVAIHQFLQALHQDGLDKALQLGSTVGHLATIGPGQTADASVDLPEGEYALLCQVTSPDDSVAHALKGMVKPLTATAGR